MEKLNIKNQDILETIYELEKEKGKARLTDIAVEMDFSKSRTNQEIKKLIDLGLVEDNRYSPITLTKIGVFEAQRVVFTHLLIKTFLQTHLGLDDETARKDACAMEHIISEETIKAIVAHLREHHKSIGDFNLNEAEEYLVKKKRLSELKNGQQAKILKIEGSQNTKRKLLEAGIVKEGIISCLKTPAPGNALEYKIKGSLIFLKIKDADNVIVELLD